MAEAGNGGSKGEEPLIFDESLAERLQAMGGRAEIDPDEQLETLVDLHTALGTPPPEIPYSISQRLSRSFAKNLSRSCRIMIAPMFSMEARSRYAKLGTHMPDGYGNAGLDFDIPRLKPIHRIADYTYSAQSPDLQDSKRDRLAFHHAYGLLLRETNGEDFFVEPWGGMDETRSMAYGLRFALERGEGPLEWGDKDTFLEYLDNKGSLVGDPQNPWIALTLASGERDHEPPAPHAGSIHPPLVPEVACLHLALRHLTDNPPNRTLRVNEHVVRLGYNDERDDWSILDQARMGTVSGSLTKLLVKLDDVPVM